jgi:hypothetical protein
VSDPIAVSILSKLTSWYTFDSTLEDAHGTNDLIAFSGVSYSAGLKSDQLDSASSADCDLSPAVAALPNAGQYTVGGWFNFVAGVADRPEFGLAYDSAEGEEAFTIVVSTDGGFYLQTFIAPLTDDPVVDPLAGAINYPVRVSVDDSLGQTAYSDQVIRVATGGTLVPGRYFVVGTWNLGARTLYVDSLAVATAAAPATLKDTQFRKIRVGRDASLSVTDMDECFVCLSSYLTAAEVAWLYNSGSGRSYAEVVAAAA